MTIIAATDFSPSGDHATRVAARLARKLDDALLVAHVVEPPLQYNPYVPDAPAYDALLRDTAEQLMSRLLTELRQDGGSIDGRVLHGSPTSSLNLLATDERPRLLVLGSHGRGQMGRLFFGSVAERTMLTAPCPVLVVPDQANPFDQWSRDGRPLRVVAGLDRDSAGDAVLAAIDGLRGAGPCQVTLIHEYWPPAEWSRLGASDPWDQRRSDVEIVAALDRELRSRFHLDASRADVGLRVRSAWARPGEALAHDAEAAVADLLVVGTRQPHGLTRLRTGSSSVLAARNARMAVLCAPALPRPVTAPSGAPIPLLRTILVGTDLSEVGNAAIPFAYSLLRAAGGTVELCHIREHQVTPGPYPAARAPLALTPEQRGALEDQLSALIPRDAERLAVTTHLDVIDGSNAAEALLQSARRLGADAIVLASHGRTGLGRALLGSVTESVVRQSERPVFVVRGPAAD